MKKQFSAEMIRLQGEAFVGALLIFLGYDDHWLNEKPFKFLDNLHQFFEDFKHFKILETLFEKNQTIKFDKSEHFIRIYIKDISKS